MQRYILGLAGYAAALILPGPVAAEKAVPAPSPISSAPTFTLTTGGTTLQVSTANSARINSLKYLGTELLYLVSSGGNILWGSTFWASPQAYWTASCKSANTLDCWPPPAAMDGNAYTGGPLAADTTLSYTGTAESYTKLRFRKTFSADLKDSSFTNTYYMVNTSASPVTWAPWEDTRFPSGGITFWPTGSGAPTGNANLLKQVKDTLGVTWFTYDSSATLSGTTKIFADGGAAGWMAHVDKNRILFIKKFADTPPAKKAPGVENECEMYITQALQEMELQGPYDPIPANDSAAWSVKWFVRKLPDGVAVSRNKALADFTAQVIQGAGTGLAGGRGQAAGFSIQRRRGSLELETYLSMHLSISLANARGRELALVAERTFEAGRHTLALPSRKAGGPGPLWVLVRDRKSAPPVYKRLLAEP